MRRAGAGTTAFLAYRQPCRTAAREGPEKAWNDGL